MPISQPLALEKLNNYFQKNIMNTDVLSLYYQMNHKTLSQDISSLINSTTKQRPSIFSTVAKKMAICLSQNEERYHQILSSKKKTDITQHWTNILIPKQKDRKLVETLRNKLIVKLRKGDGIGRAQFQAFRTLYELISQSDLKINFDQQNCQNQKEIKSILISLKKLMGVGKSERQMSKKVKKAKRKAYLSNIDIKSILNECCFMIQEKQLKMKVQNLLKDSKNKSWFGPNLYKAFESSNFTVQEMYIMTTIMESISFDQMELKTNQNCAQRTLKKIIANLKIYLKDKVSHQIKIEEMSPSEQIFDIQMKDQEQEMNAQYSEDQDDDNLLSAINFSPQTLLQEQERGFKSRMQFFDIEQEPKQEFTLFHTLCFNGN